MHAVADRRAPALHLFQGADMTKKLITPIAIALFALTSPTANAANSVCVKVTEANLRQGPGTHFRKTWTVFAYMPFKKIGQKGSWYRVQDVDGDKHWISSKLVSSKLRCAVIKTEKARVRRGPGTRYPLAGLGTIEKYYSFKVIGDKGRWMKVKDDLGNSGWIAKSLLWVQ
jgi:SH3-like domain-containing protein